MPSSPSSPTRKRVISGCPRPAPTRPTTTATKTPSSASHMAIDSIWNDTYAAIALHLVIALAAGGIIGLERSYHGRPAGFRTHALVCLSSCMLMVLTVYQETWFSAYSLETISVDPTRMAQGIMTGIGFLGAGVIMKEGLTIRGLTTAASIWITAAIGIMIGVGFYFPAGISTAMTLIVPIAAVIQIEAA